MILENKEMEKIFKALADEKRIRILEFLQNGEKCACDIQDMLDIAQSALSYHMKILCDSTIVQGRNEGKWTHYTISERGVNIAFESLRQATNMNFESLNSESIILAETKIKEDKDKKKKTKKEKEKKKKNKKAKKERIEDYTDAND